MPGEDRIRLPREKPQYSREQKAALGIIIGFGSFALIFGGFYLWNHIASPFSVSYSGPRFLTGDEKEAEETRRARQTDTDKDGINDYDELYIYKTSPYLTDSDSDGMNDQTEVTSGGDPNCAAGAACDVSDETQQGELEGGFLDETADAYRDASGASPTERTLDQVLGDLTPEQIRQLLIESGGNPADINALSDAQLMEYFSAALAELKADGGAEAATEEPSETSAAGETVEPTTQ